MGVKLVRVFCKQVADPNEDPITFDVFVDEFNIAQNKCMTFGFMGSPKEDAERFLLFALRTTGRLGNGSNTDEPDDTNEALNPFGKKMNVGEFITYYEDEEEKTYRIHQVTDLAGAHK